MEHFSLSDWLTAAGYTFLAMVGGAIGYVMRERDRGGTISGWYVAIEAVASGFVGFLVMLLCRAMGIDPLWAGFVVGVFGWLGANVSIRLLERFAYEKLGIKLRADTEERVAHSTIDSGES